MNKDLELTEHTAMIAVQQSKEQHDEDGGLQRRLTFSSINNSQAEHLMSMGSVCSTLIIIVQKVGLLWPTSKSE
jgi:hypothetical protein